MSRLKCEEKIDDTGFGKDFLNRAQRTQETPVNWTSSKLKYLLAKYTAIKLKRQITDWN